MKSSLFHRMVMEEFALHTSIVAESIDEPSAHFFLAPRCERYMARLASPFGMRQSNRAFRY